MKTNKKNKMAMMVKKKHHGKPFVSLLHLDADLYESTITVIDGLAPFFANGTILVFDDIVVHGQVDFENCWYAFTDTLTRIWPWRMEVLAAPWRVGSTSVLTAEGGAALAFRLLAPAPAPAPGR